MSIKLLTLIIFSSTAIFLVLINTILMLISGFMCGTLSNNTLYMISKIRKILWIMVLCILISYCVLIPLWIHLDYKVLYNW